MDNDRDRDVDITLTREQVEAVMMWRELDFDRKAEEWLADAGLKIEEFFGATAYFLDGCVARGELDKPTAERVKALYSKGIDEAKRGLQERISEARIVLFSGGDEPFGEQ